MNILRLPQGTYVDALPSGAYACLMVDASDHAWMETHLHPITIDGDHRPLFVRVAEGPFRFAGQSSNSPQTSQWIDGQGWQPLEAQPCGINPVIWDASGQLVINCHPTNYGSQGFRFVDDTGRIWSGDETIAAKPGTYVAEWTDIGDGMTIGQCNLTPGMALWDGTNVRMILAGDSFFIRAHRLGNAVALACTRHVAEGAVIIWTTVDELRALPIVPVVPPIVYPPVAPFDHAVSIAPFKDVQGMSGSDSEVCIDGALGARGDTRRRWVGFDLDGGSTAIRAVHASGELYGIAAEGFGPRGYDAARPLADALQTRIAWWNDGWMADAPPSGPPQGLLAWDQIWLEWYWYLERGESLSDAVGRWEQDYLTAAKTACHDLGGIPQYFTRGVLSEQQTVDCIGKALETFSRQPRLKVLAPFEYDRANGITGLASLREMYDRTLAASVHGVPVFVPAWPSPPLARDDRRDLCFARAWWVVLNCKPRAAARRSL